MNLWSFDRMANSVEPGPAPAWSEKAKDIIQYEKNINDTNTDGSFTWLIKLVCVSLGCSSGKWKDVFVDILKKSSREYLSCVFLLESTSSRQFLWVHSTYHYFIPDRKDIPKFSPFVSWSSAMIDHQCLEQPMSRTNLHGPKHARAIRVLLYFFLSSGNVLADLVLLQLRYYNSSIGNRQ